mgnify:FL=1
MCSGYLTINKQALINNLKKLQRLSTSETGSVVKANAYGLGSREIVKILATHGVRKFFVATIDEAKIIRKTLGEFPEIYVFSGHLLGDTRKFIDLKARPILNSISQLTRHNSLTNELPFAIQIDTGMNRLGITPNDWVKELATGADFIMSHLSCADDPLNVENQRQLNKFLQMTSGVNVPRSLSATAGILLGDSYHFDLTRPGIGLYGGFPFVDSENVVSLDIPVIQTKIINKGESIGYGASFVAKKEMKIATISAGYADGIIRSLSRKAIFYSEGLPCRVVGRISMDLITVDISKLKNEPDTLNFIGPSQSIDQVAEMAKTIGHEILTSLGNRYSRTYK